MICLKLGSWLASQKADKNVQLHCRSPHGERGLKRRRMGGIETARGRSPHGERGLKRAEGAEIRSAGHVALLMESVD